MTTLGPRNPDVAFQALTDTIDPTRAIMTDVLASLHTIAGIWNRPSPARAHRAPTDPRNGTPRAPRPFTLPVRPRQTFGDVA